jgi:hypothetical protein
VMNPDEKALVDDLESDRFMSGADHGYWRLVARAGVLVTFDLAAKNGRRVGVRLNCSGYPGVAPTGQLWSVPDDAPLPVAQWPQGGRASAVFNPNWSPKFGGAFYFPYDRRALDGHGAWASAHPGHVWGVDKTVVDVLYLLREVLRTATTPIIDAAGQEEEAS